MKIEWGKTADKKMNLQEANDYIKSLNLNKYFGFDDWRLSTRAELIEAYDTNIDGFLADYYWSSTTDVNNTGYAWLVGFGYGSVGSGYKTGSFYVRPVRGGQCVDNLLIEESEIIDMLNETLGKLIKKL